MGLIQVVPWNGSDFLDGTTSAAVCSEGIGKEQSN